MSSEYKRLGWVQAYASQGTGLAANIYSQARTMVPGFAETFVLQLEETAINIAVPYVTVAQDSAVKVLSSVDAQVDKSMGLIEGVHSKNLATFNGAKEQCYSYVEGTVNQAKALLDPTPYIQWTSDKVAVYANPDKIVDTSFQILDPVAGKVATLVPEPVIKTGLKTYGTVHDTVVGLPLYKTLWDLVWSTTSSVQDTWAFKKVMEVGYPYLAPVADPVVSNISNSKYLKQLQAHLTPVKAL
jgi:hypothetical protein